MQCLLFRSTHLKIIYRNAVKEIVMILLMFIICLEYSRLHEYFNAKVVVVKPFATVVENKFSTHEPQMFASLNLQGKLFLILVF